MRVAHFIVGRVNPESASGADKTVLHLSIHQARLGVDVGVFCLSEKPPIAIQGVHVENHRPGQNPLALPKSLQLGLERWRPDVIHIHSVYTPPNIPVARWAKRHAVHYVVTPNGGLSPHLLHRRGYLKIPYRFLFELKILNDSAFIHAVGDARDIRSYGVKVPIITAPNGLDLSTLPPSDDSLLKRRFPALEGKTVLLFMGRLDPMHKGLDLLIEGLQRSGCDECVLVLMGPDWKGGRALLEEQVTRLGINERVVFLGPVFGEEKFSILASADIFVHTSRWEGLPFSVLEAMGMRLPVIVTDAADPLGRVGPTLSGWVVDPSSERIAMILQTAVSSREEMVRRGANAYELVDQEFSWQNSAAVLVAAYGEATAGGRV